ncbi:hypothetical protein NDU88_002846 [Pleurodeles waltl]|uniref:Uncharacterized protein n=1 Tax=Pleurodeles waltl TaxID=8319 RepID=A0AAV7TPA1_PLEWA|nr:hypothetical protein NDU88_002846 [Pleurodeles waltl]
MFRATIHGPQVSLSPWCICRAAASRVWRGTPPPWAAVQEARARCGDQFFPAGRAAALQTLAPATQLPAISICRLRAPVCARVDRLRCGTHLRPPSGPGPETPPAPAVCRTVREPLTLLAL